MKGHIGMERLNPFHSLPHGSSLQSSVPSTSKSPEPAKFNTLTQEASAGQASLDSKVSRQPQGEVSPLRSGSQTYDKGQTSYDEQP